MSDPLRKVQPGQLLAISAAAYNTPACRSPLRTEADSSTLSSRRPSIPARRDNDGPAIVKKPVAVYVEKVYEEASFAGLGIGS